MSFLSTTGGGGKSDVQFVSVNSKTGKQKVTLRCSDCRSKRRDYYYNNKDYFDRVNKVARITHKDAIVRRNKIYQQNNKDRTAKWHQNKESKLKNKFLCMYGGKCQCCGESEEVFLCLDHINGQVGKKKKEASALRRAIKVYNAEEFRILCCNCNSAVRYGRVCPHQRKLNETLNSDTII